MRTVYSYVKRFSPTMVGLSSARYGRQIWLAGKLRKPAKCYISGTELVSGTVAYRPQTNLSNRMERISVEAINELEKALK